MYDVDKIMTMLDWNNSDEVQKKGVELAGKIKSINVFLQPLHPGNNKNVWGNCAKILSSKSDVELEPYLIQLLEWLEDLNWPGAEIIYDRLRSMPPTLICHAYSYCLRVAIQTNDYPWLSCLKTFSDNVELVSLLPESQRETLARTDF